MIVTAFSLVGLRFGGAAMGLVSQILLARLLPQNEVGIVFMATSSAAIFSLLMTGGYPSLTMTVLPRYIALGRKRLIDAFHSAVWRESLMLGSVLLVLAVAAYLWAPLDPALRMALAFGFLMSPAASLIRISSSAANSQKRFHLSYVPDFIFRPGLLLAVLLPAFLAGYRPALTEVLFTIITIAFAVAIGQALIIGRSILPSSLLPKRHDLVPLLRGRAFAMVIVAAVTMSFADIVTLLGGLFLPAHDVAELGIAVRLAALAGFVTQVTQNFVLPDLSAAIVKGDRPLARTLILRINLIAIAAISACVVLAVFFGPLILSVFGPDYGGAHWPLVLFMVSQLFRAAGGMNQHVLSLDGFQKRTASACVFSLSVLAAAASLLTPLWGVLGMALSVLLAEAVWAAILGLQAHHHSGYRGDILAALRAIRQPAE